MICCYFHLLRRHLPRSNPEPSTEPDPGGHRRRVGAEEESGSETCVRHVTGGTLESGEEDGCAITITVMMLIVLLITTI